MQVSNKKNLVIRVWQLPAETGRPVSEKVGRSKVGRFHLWDAISERIVIETVHGQHVVSPPDAT